MSLFAAFDIRLTDDYITIGPVALIPRANKVDKLVQLLGPPERILELQYNNTVYIYDHAGIRFWAEAGVVGEFQLVLETEARDTFPTSPFVGPIEYRKRVVDTPIPGEMLNNGELPGFIQDTEHLQYGVIMYTAKMPLIAYTAIVSALTGNIKSISII